MTFPHNTSRPTPSVAGKVRRITGRVLSIIAAIGLATAAALLAYGPVAEVVQVKRINEAQEIHGTGTSELKANTTYALYDTGDKGGTCTITAPDGLTFEPTIGQRHSVNAGGQSWDAEGTFTPTEAGTYAFDCADETGPQTAKVFEGSDLDPIGALFRMFQGIALGVPSLLALLVGLAFIVAGTNARQRALLAGRDRSA